MIVTFKFLLTGHGHSVMFKSIVSDVMPSKGMLVEDPAFAVGKYVERVVVSLDRAWSSDRCELRVDLEDETIEDAAEFTARESECAARGWGGKAAGDALSNRVNPVVQFIDKPEN